MPSSTQTIQKWLTRVHAEHIKPYAVNWHAVERDLEWLIKTPSAHIITIEDNKYPKLLRTIHTAPPVLYALGDADCLQTNALAIVGTRHCTAQGAKVAGAFAKSLGALGLAITSGLAYGIDRAAHIGALSCESAKTIACLAHGLDTVYPRQHAGLAQKIAEQGCLVSEFATGVIPLPKNFPRRNRIISGLCLGLLVVEADIKSGSLISARYAIDQGREVFAVPGSIHLRQVRGCHQLIKQGAKLVESLDDIVEELEALLNHHIRDKYAGYIKTRTERGLFA